MLDLIFRPSFQEPTVTNFDQAQKDGATTVAIQEFKFDEKRFLTRDLTEKKPPKGWAGVKRWYANSFGANAIRGHFISVFIGMITPGIDLMLFGRFSDFGLLGVFASFVIFPPLLLAAKGQDVEQEGSEFFWLTFGPSRVFGNFFGGFLFTMLYLLLTKFCPAYESYILMIRGYFDLVNEAGELNTEILVSGLTFGNIQALLVGVRVCWSFFMVGQLSRSFLNALVASFGSFPSHARRVIGMLTEHGLQHRVRLMEQRLLAYKSRYVQATLPALLDSVIEKLMKDPEVALGDVHDTIELFKRFDRELSNWGNETDSPVSVINFPKEN